MSLLHTNPPPFELRNERWLIEALSQLSSNPQVRDAAAAWLAAYYAALRRGDTEADAHAEADDALQRTAGWETALSG